MYQKHLNGDQVNSLIMLTTFFMILLFNSSCVYVPLPAHDLTKGVINKEVIKSLKPGETTREDLLLLVGAPETEYEQGRYFIYEWAATEGIFVSYGDLTKAPIVIHYFCVVFDDNNQIKRFAHFKSGSYFKSDLLKSKVEALDEKNELIHESEK